MERNTFPDIPNEIRLKDSESVNYYREFLKDKTVVVVMGCGHGDFLLEKTLEHPDKFYIGIEISRKRAFKTSSRLAKRGIQNYAVVDSEGELALKLLFPEAFVDEIHVNFPDPWLRKRHWKNRILKPSFLIQAHRILKPESFFYFVTDVKEYAEHSSENLCRFPGFVNHYDAPVITNLYESFPTLFYRKMSPLREINYICYRKKAVL